MNKKRQFGLFLTVVGILIILSSVSGITGNVISNVFVEKSLFTIIGLAFFVGGLVLFISGERYKKIVEEMYRRNVYVDETKDFKKIAGRLGFRLEPGYKEGTRVYDEENVLTVIPKSRKVSRGVSKGILESFVTRESSFRRRTS